MTDTMTPCHPTRRLFRRFASERRGVAAIEFALVAPLLLSLYFLTMEVSQGIEANKKIGRTASMTADLVTQLPEAKSAELDAIMQIGAAVMQPYWRSEPTVIITAIQMSPDPTPNVTVAWSRKMVDGAFSVDAARTTPTDVPAALRIPNTFLIRVTATLEYKPVIVWADKKADLGLLAAFDRLPMSETYYLRPRISTTIPCEDC